MFLTKEFMMSSQPGETHEIYSCLKLLQGSVCWTLDWRIPNPTSLLKPGGVPVLAMFAYGGVRAMFCV